MPSSLTWSHSRALGFSPHPPVSVYGTVKSRTTYEGFLGSVVRRLPGPHGPVRIGFQVNAPPDFSWEDTPTALPRDNHYTGPLTFLRHLLSHSPQPSSGILTGCPSSTPFGLDLGPTNPEPTNVAQGNLRFSATRILTLFLATYSDILTS